MITVAHLITKLELGGAQENTLYTCQHLDRSQFRVALLYGPGGMLDDEAAGLGDTTVTVIPDLVRPPKPHRDTRALASLVFTLKKLQYEHAAGGFDPTHFVVHTHSSKAGILGRFAARAAGVPNIVHTIHGFGFYRGQKLVEQAAFVALERAAARCTDAFIGVSRANLAEGMARGIILPHHHTELIRSGMRLDLFRDLDALRASARAKLGLEARDAVVLSIANFKPQKDPLTMIRAMAALTKTHAHAVLLFAGDGPLRSSVEREVTELGLRDHVRLLGWRRDVPELLAACDIVGLSSIFEGLPRSAVQAIAARRPFVGTRVDGTPEIIRSGKNGYLVEPRDPARLGAALGRALDERPVDVEDTQRILDWDGDRMVEQQAQLYRRLVTSTHRS